jgi:hypothetical protein
MKTSPVVIGILALFCCSSGLSQSLKVGLGGGAAFIQSPEGFTRDISQVGMGFGMSYAIGGEAKSALLAVPLTLVGHVSYLSMSGSGTFNNPVFVPAMQGSIETKTHVLSIGLGGEWTLMPGPIAPYVGPISS